jgi:hypothetical protein
LFPLFERVGFDISIRQSYDGGRFVDAPWYTNRKAPLNPDAVRYVDNLLAQPAHDNITHIVHG